MQSIRQYRRLRQQVQEDLVYSRQARLPSDSDDKSSGVNMTEKPDVFDPNLVPGVSVSHTDEGGLVYVVGWKENDPSNPQVWSLPRKWVAMVTCCCIGISLTIPTSVEGPTQDAFNAHFDVNPMAGSMSTGNTHSPSSESN
ncbi:uncharacterized protein LDX57_005131 [Aspergillus melleus]|uniref:uncharacterized protein n=1 Tax=Aspergillus melleus TaxID=138277 RepID=UPI001E8CE39D|nr:uncharacterized protein LDX57_005131 [Aspergillus melleus]KAH8427416.1 hypothetical protein LDX57_005131 [Aspergillus melleus]